MISERIKLMNNHQIHVSPYFWRTYAGAEIDYVEERQGKVYTFEVKLNRKVSRAPQTWMDQYGDHFACITQNNFFELVCWTCTLFNACFLNHLDNSKFIYWTSVRDHRRIPLLRGSTTDSCLKMINRQMFP